MTKNATTEKKAEEKKKPKEVFFNDDFCNGILSQSMRRFSQENNVKIKSGEITFILSDGKFDYEQTYKI